MCASHLWSTDCVNSRHGMKGKGRTGARPVHRNGGWNRDRHLGMKLVNQAKGRCFAKHELTDALYPFVCHPRACRVGRPGVSCWGDGRRKDAALQIGFGPKDT